MKKIVKAIWRLNYGANVEFEGSTPKEPDYMILPNESVFRFGIKVGSEFDTESGLWITAVENPDIDLGDPDDEALKKAFDSIGAKLGQEKGKETPPPVVLEPEIPTVAGLTIAPTNGGGE